MCILCCKHLFASAYTQTIRFIFVVFFFLSFFPHIFSAYVQGFVGFQLWFICSTISYYYYYLYYFFIIICTKFDPAVVILFVLSFIRRLMPFFQHVPYVCMFLLFFVLLANVPSLHTLHIQHAHIHMCMNHTIVNCLCTNAQTKTTLWK